MESCIRRSACDGGSDDRRASPPWEEDGAALTCANVKVRYHWMLDIGSALYKVLILQAIPNLDVVFVIPLECVCFDT